MSKEKNIILDLTNPNAMKEYFEKEENLRRHCQMTYNKY